MSRSWICSIQMQRICRYSTEMQCSRVAVCWLHLCCDTVWKCSQIFPFNFPFTVKRGCEKGYACWESDWTWGFQCSRSNATTYWGQFLKNGLVEMIFGWLGPIGSTGDNDCTATDIACLHQLCSVKDLSWTFNRTTDMCILVYYNTQWMVEPPD
jgi:hypothetical protein